MSETSPDTYWRRKLSACMHDTPGKVQEIWSHWERAVEQAKPDDFQEYEWFNNDADHHASAADRLPWPKSQVLRAKFDGISNFFRHPMSGNEAPYKFDVAFPSAAEAEKGGQVTRPTLSEGDDRAEFLARWRFWRWWASDFDPRLAYMPAETRLPDHTIWSHLWVTSAFEGCSVGDDRTIRPATLLFQIGPVQQFISEAKTTRDLWSGSYLLSYLAGRAMMPIIEELGPDHFLFPNLCGQPIVDLLMKKPVWDKSSSSREGNLWDCFGYDSAAGRKRLLTPNLPNRFLCILPQDRAEEFAKKAEEAFRLAIDEISKDVESGLLEGFQGFSMPENWSWDARRYQEQVRNMLSCNWQVHPWPLTVDEAMEQAKEMPDFKDGLEGVSGLRNIMKMAAGLSADHRDGRMINQEGGLTGVGAAHAELYHYTGWLLSGLKNCNTFDAWDSDASAWRVGNQDKDQLNGREEALLRAIGPEGEDNAEEMSKALSGGKHGERHLLSKGELLGASTLVKRFWHRHHLLKHYKDIFEARDFSMGNTHSISQGRPFERDADEDGQPGQSYYAVLAMDGDRIGKWLSGAMAPFMENLMSSESCEYYAENQKEFLKVQRPISPSYHLQFSEVLSTFANQCAARIVEAHNGRLVYAGGDDVLALLPASRVIPCAKALRAAFKGDMDELNQLSGGWFRREGEHDYKHLPNYRIFNCRQKGYLRLNGGAEHTLQEDPVNHDAILPGPAMEVSAGIAIGHAKDPLQRLVEAARQAEKAAKNVHGRAAVAINIVKRSGELVQWGCKWNSGGLELLETMDDMLSQGQLSARYPYKVLQFLEPYIHETETGRGNTEFDDALESKMDELIEAELGEALSSHLQGSGKESKPDLVQQFVQFAKELQKTGEDEAGLQGGGVIENLISLHQTLAWVNKHHADKQQSPVQDSPADHNAVHEQQES